MSAEVQACEHNFVTSTFALGPHCCDCRALLVGIFTPILRDTPAGAILWAMKQAATTPMEATR